MSEYTKGPWEVVSDTCECEYPCSHKPFPIGIDKVDWDNMSWSDANLIAAAPELLEALEELLKAEWMVTHDWGGDRDAVKDKAYAAIAKAKAKGDNQ